MRNYLIITLVIISFSCVSNQMCNSNKNYLKANIDTTRIYTLKGTYCLSFIKDTIIDQGNSIVSFNVFDRINGKPVEDGVVRFYGSDTVSMVFSKFKHQIILPPGKYSMEAFELGYDVTKTKMIDLIGNKKVEIIFYLGTTHEH